MPEPIVELFWSTMTDDTYSNPMAHRGQDVLNDPLLNKGTAFTLDERRLLRIEGHVPPTEAMNR